VSSPLDRISEEAQTIIEYGIAVTPEDVLALVNVAKAAEEGQAIYDRFDDGTDLRSAYGKRKGDVQIELDRWCYRFFGPDGTLCEALAALDKEQS
jgi:hypothetical protein